MSIVSGSTYTVYSLQVGYGQESSQQPSAGDGNGTVSHNLSGEDVIYTLNANGTVDAIYNYFEQSSSVDYFKSLADTQIAYVYDENSDHETGSTSGTWSLTGNQLSLAIDGDTYSFTVSPDGNMLLDGGVEMTEINPNLDELPSMEVEIGIRSSVAP